MFKKVALAVAAALAAQGASAAAIDFHGYVREGVGSTSKGGQQVCFSAPYTQSKSRFGNECDNYSELSFGVKAYKGADGAQFNYVTTFASKHTNEKDYQAADLASRESYVSGTGVLPGFLKSAELWVGKRFYQRHDIHATDEFYLGNTGSGWGVSGIDVGFGKFSYAYLVSGVDPSSNSRHDFRLAGIPLAKDVSLEVGFLTLKGNPVKDSANDGNEKLSYTLFAEGTVSNFMGGFNKTFVALHTGRAIWDGVNSYESGYKDLDNAGNEKTPDAKQLVIINHGKINLSSDLELGTVVRLNKWMGDVQDNTTSLQLVARPHFTLTENTALVAEVELTRTLKSENSGAEGGQFTKLTGAYTVQAGKGWWARPQVRFFGTYAAWNDAAKAWGTPGGGRFGDSNNGLSYGVQAEAWW